MFYVSPAGPPPPEKKTRTHTHTHTQTHADTRPSNKRQGRPIRLTAVLLPHADVFASLYTCQDVSTIAAAAVLPLAGMFRHLLDLYASRIVPHNCLEPLLTANMYRHLVIASEFNNYHPPKCLKALAETFLAST